MLENKWYDVNENEMFCMRKQKTKNNRLIINQL